MILQVRPHGAGLDDVRDALAALLGAHVLAAFKKLEDPDNLDPFLIPSAVVIDVICDNDKWEGTAREDLKPPASKYRHPLAPLTTREMQIL
jgi:hypothetical protein